MPYQRPPLDDFVNLSVRITSVEHAAPHRIQMVTLVFQTVMFGVAFAGVTLRRFRFQYRKRDTPVIVLCLKRVLIASGRAVRVSKP